MLVWLSFCPGIVRGFSCSYESSERDDAGDYLFDIIIDNTENRIWQIIIEQRSLK